MSAKTLSNEPMKVGDWFAIETAKQSIQAAKSMTMSNAESIAKLTEFAAVKCASAEIYCAIRTLRDATNSTVAA